MATASVAAAERERRFYGRMAIAMLVIVFLGFAPSFYLRGLVHVPRPNPVMTPFVWFHGFAFTAWMLLFYAQTRLVAAGRRDIHMQLGRAGMAFAIALVPLMYLTAVGQVVRANQPPFATPLGWTAIPLVPIPAFIALVALGWHHRRNAQAHKRLMLGAMLLMMDPAIGRLPILPPSFVSQSLLAALTWSMSIPLIIWDYRTRGSLHWATITAAGLLAAALILRMFALASPAWATFAAGLPGV
jgi:hypothetical protein